MAVYADSVFTVSPKHAATWPRLAELKKTLSTLSACQIVRYHSDHLFCFRFVTLHFFYILLQPHYGTLPIPPSSVKTSVAYPLRPLDGNTPNSCFFFFLFFFAILKRNYFTLRWKPGLCPFYSFCFFLLPGPLALPPGDGGTVTFMKAFNVLCNYPGNTCHHYSRQ